jgi:hypothetical protein
MRLLCQCPLKKWLPSLFRDMRQMLLASLVSADAVSSAAMPNLRVAERCRACCCAVQDAAERTLGDTVSPAFCARDCGDCGAQLQLRLSGLPHLLPPSGFAS